MSAPDLRLQGLLRYGGEIVSEGAAGFSIRRQSTGEVIQKIHSSIVSGFLLAGYISEADPGVYRLTPEGIEYLRAAGVEPRPTRPRIVCLCGSTRFYEHFQAANFAETMAGRIVLSVGFFAHRPEAMPIHGETVGITPEQKIELDALHFRKIELADEILVLNVGGYIGESTRREIEHATELKKPVRYLEAIS